MRDSASNFVRPISRDTPTTTCPTAGFCVGCVNWHCNRPANTVSNFCWNYWSFSLNFCKTIIKQRHISNVCCHVKSFFQQYTITTCAVRYFNSYSIGWQVQQREWIRMVKRYCKVNGVLTVPTVCVSTKSSSIMYTGCTQNAPLFICAGRVSLHRWVIANIARHNALVTNILYFRNQRINGICGCIAPCCAIHSITFRNRIPPLK